PDLPKGSQISMYELPLAEHGYIDILTDGETGKRIGLTRIHMEEDAGKNLHEGFESGSRVDLNRAGIPLLEIVSEPDLRSPQEAVAYLKSLRAILIYTEVSDADMEKGNFRCDANVSIRPAGASEFGKRTEIKNMNSFRFVQKALAFEIARQERVLEEGGKIVQETRLWDDKNSVTQSMRSKEEAHDYRYFPEPDLVPLTISQAWIDKIAAELPELPDTKRERFVKEYALPVYDATILTGSQTLADFYEKTVALYPKPKVVSNWVMGDLLRELNNENKEIDQAAIRPESLAAMLKLIDAGTISGKIAKTVFEEIYRTGTDPQKIVKEKGLTQISDESELDLAIQEVMAANPKEVEGYRSGKEKLLGFFVGQVMKRFGGKANPGKVNQLLKKRLHG
ncbi:MAG: Asp-tRNA(Asn)/Glu-tRNA(Gln) amidotransferase subunit GatB, partial [Nitrospiria bacterium]